MSLTGNPKIEYDIAVKDEGRFIQYYFWDDKTEQEDLQEKLDWNMGYGPYPQPKIVRYLSNWLPLHKEASGEFIKIEGQVHYKKYFENKK